jgi:hypothetical protein
MIGVPLQKLLPDKIEDSADFESRVSVITARLHPRIYLEELKSSLISEIESANPSKEHIDSILTNIITTKINMGFSSTYIHQVVKNKINIGDGKSTPEKLSDLFNELNLKNKKYNVLLKVDIQSNSVKEDHYDAFGIQFSNEIPQEFLISPKRKNDEIFADCSYRKLVTISDINALDPHTAVNSAIGRLRSLFDLVAIFDHKSKISVEPSARSLNTETQKCLRVSSLRNRMTFIDEKQTSRKLGDLNAFLSDMRFASKKELLKVVRAITLHGQAIATPNEEAQLLNIWTAMEVVGRNMRHSSIVDDVSESVLPVLILGYPSRIVDNWGKRVEIHSSEFVDFCKNNSKDSDWKLNFLLKRMGEKEHGEACKILSANPALLFRSYTIGRRFSTPKDLLEDLSRHESFVRWQIHRVYRARNIITHSGASPSYCGALIDCAHDYLDQIISDIGRNLCSDRPFKSLADMLLFAEINLSNWRTALKSMGNWDDDIAGFMPEE